MAVTIKDIARVAGVSHTTVSRALRDHPAISSETIERVKSLALEMGYMPNATARGLKTRRTRALGVVVSHLDDPFWSEVLQGIDAVLHPAGYSLFVSATLRDKRREREVVEELVQRGVDGVILLAPQFNANQYRLLKNYRLPVAIVNNEGAEDFQYSVFNDDIYGIRLITRHLLDLGHRRIAFLGNAVGGRTTQMREHGFRQTMEDAGVEVREEYVLMAPTGSPEGGFEAASCLISQPERPTAVVCYNDHMAIGVYSAVIEAGLCIPDDISVTGFDDISLCPYLNPPLTTLRQPKYHLGSGAAEILLKLLDQQHPLNGERKLPPPEKVALYGELVVRRSTCPPPAEV